MAKKQNENTVTLDDPLVRGTGENTKQITEVTLRKPKSGELRGLKLVQLANGDVDSMMRLIPRISSPALTEDELNGMDVADFSALIVVVVNFLEQKSGSLAA